MLLEDFRILLSKILLSVFVCDTVADFEQIDRSVRMNQSWETGNIFMAVRVLIFCETVKPAYNMITRDLNILLFHTDFSLIIIWVTKVLKCVSHTPKKCFQLQYN